MTEAEIRALIADAFTRLKEKAEAKVTDSGIQLDTAMVYLANAAEEVALEIANGG